MGVSFSIVLMMKSEKGFEPYGQFDLGNDRKLAHEVFSKLNGSRLVMEEHLLQLQFRETIQGLPVNMDLISCTLQQLEENCGIITKEIFKGYNLVSFSENPSD